MLASCSSDGGGTNNPEPIAYAGPDRTGKTTTNINTPANGEGKTTVDTVVAKLIEDMDLDDLDRDGDGFLNTSDTSPDDIASHLDSNSDGTGNYYTPDEDQDGTDDLNDARPLDATTSTRAIYTEATEPASANQNDGIGVSETAGDWTNIITGSIDATNNRTDIDYFKVNWDAGRYTVVLKGNALGMTPLIAVMDGSGVPVSSASANVPTTPGTSAAAIIINTASDYFISITDSSGKSDPAWTYTLNIVADSDSDGIGDDVEQALDSNHLNADSDGDGISDFIEINLALEDWAAFGDSDNDNIPLWWDTDSDGDNLPDNVEYYTAEERPDLDSATLAKLNDMDEDGIPNFLDSDSDGNGVANDSEEAGTNPWKPDDSDKDGIPDYLDTDDDNDGLLDTNESTGQRNTPLTQPDTGFMTPMETFNNTLNVAGTCRGGDSLHLTGTDVPAGVSNMWVILRGGSTILNVQPSGRDDDGINFDCPANIGDGLFEIFVATADERSLSLALMVPKSNAPILTGATVDGSSQTVTFTGLNLDGSLSINFTGASKTQTSYSETTVAVTLPNGASAGLAHISTIDGDSNQIWVSPASTVSGNIIMPVGSTIDITTLDVAWSPLDEVHPAANGSFTTEVNFTGADVLTALVPDPAGTEEDPRYATYLQAVLLPTDSSVTLDVDSTALALVWQGVGATSLLNSADWPQARSDIAALSEVATFASVLESELLANPLVLSSYPVDSDIQSATEAASLAAANLISTNFTTVSATARITPLGKFGPPATVTPVEVDDISVYERGDTGNISIENDTQLYLSAKITGPKKQVLHPHISGFSGMAGPQGYGLFLYASTSEYREPDGEDATVEVITAGIGREFEPKRFGDMQVWKWLYGRTLIERVVWPALAEILPLDKNAFIGVLFTHAPALVDTMVNQALAGNVKGAVSSLLTTVWQDFASAPPGPITQELAKRYGKGLAKKVLAKIAAKIGSKFVPGIGQIALAAEVAGHLSNGVNAAKAVDDILRTDQVIEFDVSFPLEVEEVLPGKVWADGKNKQFAIVGSGFSPISRGVWPFDRELMPRIHFTDADGFITTLAPSYISPDGTRMLVTVEGWFLSESTNGPLKVKVHHPVDESDATDELDPAVQIVSDVEISSLDPDKGGPGTAVKVYGSGFSSIISDNEVRVGATGAMIGNASDTWINIIIPAGLTAGIYDVTARSRHDGIWSDWSNAVPFEVEVGDVTITVCDNGALKDDAFALYVNSLYKGTMVATPGNYCDSYPLNLPTGTTHTARLLGVEAPDAIGTYSISFTGASNLTGDARSGGDLVPGVSKYYTFEVAASQPLDVLKLNKGAPYKPLQTDLEGTDRLE